MSAHHSRPDAPTTKSTSRRVLGDVSPNVRALHDAAVPPQKSVSDSPLKRGLAAAMGNSAGFTHFKKRRLSPDRALSDMCHPQQRRQSTSTHQSLPHELSISTLQHTVPTEPGTPTSPVDREEESNDSSAERRSFSSLINYDPSSQTASQNVTKPHKDTATRLLFKGPSYAELLKLRLQVAMYKVRTDQVHMSFNDLEAQGKKDIPPEHTEVEQAVADLRAEAYRKQAEAQARSHAHPVAPTLLQAPILRPTKYSSRMIYESISSSPPVSARAAVTSLVSTTPAGRRRPDEIELTSSIVKGRVAEGLLGLRHAV